MSLPQRKTIRLREYDYETPGYYFVTVCTRNRQSVFGRIVDDTNGSVGGRPPCRPADDGTQRYWSHGRADVV